MPFGYHLMLELYNCNLERITSYDVCMSYLNTLPDIIGTHRQSPPFLVRTDGGRYPDKAGFSGWIPVVESGFSLHTIEPARFVSIDIYTCKELTDEILKKVKKYTLETFQPSEFEEKFVLRGEKYIGPPGIFKK